MLIRFEPRGDYINIFGDIQKRVSDSFHFIENALRFMIGILVYEDCDLVG